MDEKLPQPFQNRRNAIKQMGLGAATLGALPLLTKTQAATPQTKAGKRRNPWIYAFNIGDLEAWSISDGFMVFNNGLEMMSPDSEHGKMKAEMEAAHEKTDHIPLYVNVLVVRSDTEVMLFDAGFGLVDHPDRGWLMEGLAAIGIEPGEVTAGFLSHAHGDHIDGFVSPAGTAMFPNAAIYTTPEEFNFWRQKDPDFSSSNRNPSWIPGMVRNAQKQFEILAPQIQTTPPGSALFGGAVTVENGFGHTPGHGIFRISSAGDSLLHIVDLVHSHVLMFRNPAWSIRLDHSPQLAIDARRRIFSQAAGERTRCYGFHVPWPGIGSVARQGEGYAWIPERLWW